MSIKKAKDAEIEFGNVEVTDEDIAPAAVRRRISIMVPEDVLAKLRAAAQEEGIGYQTLINRILKERMSPTERAAVEKITLNLSTEQLDELKETVHEALKPQLQVPQGGSPSKGVVN
jgi:predicted DNA binding CopG/RHH family protein